MSSPASPAHVVPDAQQWRDELAELRAELALLEIENGELHAQLSSVRAELAEAANARQLAEQATRELQALAERLQRQTREAAADRLLIARALNAETVKSADLEKRLAVLSGRAGSLEPPRG